MNYAGFWKRFGAFLIDMVVLVPLMVIGYYGTKNFRLFQLYWLVPGAAFGLWFNFYLVARYGGTPGKLLLGTKIVMTDGSAVTHRAAFIRYSVLFLLSLVTSAGLCVASLKIADEQYFALGFIQQTEAVAQLAPSWYGVANTITNIWVISEFLTLLFNKERRALHDFMAGTVVVRTR